MRVMRLILVIGAALLLAECASVEDRMAEAKPALDAWSKCIMRAIARLDDGKTDPVSMAYGWRQNAGALPTVH